MKIRSFIRKLRSTPPEDSLWRKAQELHTYPEFKRAEGNDVQAALAAASDTERALAEARADREAEIALLKRGIAAWFGNGSREEQALDRLIVDRVSLAEGAAVAEKSARFDRDRYALMFDERERFAREKLAAEARLEQMLAAIDEERKAVLHFLRVRAAYGPKSTPNWAAEALAKLITHFEIRAALATPTTGGDQHG